MNHFNIKLTAAMLLTGLATPFHANHAAVHLSENDTGSAIIVPFYTVSNQLNTLLSLNNTTDENKAVKIHFKEGKGGDILTSFNVYLTAQDIWTMGTGQVVSTEGGKIRMVSNDQSCTTGFPNNTEIAVEDDWLWENGTIEIIEMGTFESLNALDDGQLDCQSLDSYWQAGGQWNQDSESQMMPATGGLHAEVTLMDIEQGFSANIPVIHMDGFFGEDNIQHSVAGADVPNLSTGSKDSLIMVDDAPIRTTWPTGYEAVSALLTKSTLSNEFNLSPITNAKTDWILSFPTLAYHLNSSESQKPFIVNENNAFQYPFKYSHNQIIYDREGHYSAFSCGGIGVCPPIPVDNLSHVVNNITLIQAEHSNADHPQSTLSASYSDHVETLYIPTWANYSDADYDNGHILTQLDPRGGYTEKNDRGYNSSNPAEIHEYLGLPVLGFTYTIHTNAGAQPGLLAQYASVRAHFGKKKVNLVSN